MDLLARLSRLVVLRKSYTKSTKFSGFAVPLLKSPEGAFEHRCGPNISARGQLGPTGTCCGVHRKVICPSNGWHGRIQVENHDSAIVEEL